VGSAAEQAQHRPGIGPGSRFAQNAPADHNHGIDAYYYAFDTLGHGMRFEASGRLDVTQRAVRPEFLGYEGPDSFETDPKPAQQPAAPGRGRSKDYCRQTS
jgi:hypothetical protein